MINLPTVTLCAVSSVRIDETLRALQKSMRGITYGSVIFLTDQPISTPPEGVVVHQISPLSYEEYSEFILYKLKDYITTDFVLIVQHDGYVLRPSKWDAGFLSYDYIGAPWPAQRFFTNDHKEVRVGNGGFSLRSKRLLEAPTTLGIAFSDNGTGFFNEDGFLCLYHRAAFEQAGIAFAPVEVASRFSRERWCRDSAWFPFGFHSNRRGLGIVKKILKKLI